MRRFLSNKNSTEHYQTEGKRVSKIAGFFEVSGLLNNITWAWFTPMHFYLKTQRCYYVFNSCLHGGSEDDHENGKIPNI